jgi:hypothetical protein
MTKKPSKTTDLLPMAAEAMKGRKPTSASEIAKLVAAAHPDAVKAAPNLEFNVALVVRADARKGGGTFTRTEDRPALYSLAKARRREAGAA